MDLDVRTVIMMSAVLVLILHGIIAYSLASYQSHVVSLWGASGVLSAGGMTFLAAMDALPGWVVAVWGQLLMAMGNFARLYALRALEQTVSPSWFWGQVLFHGAYLALAAWLLQAGAPQALLMMVFCAFYAFNALDYLRIGYRLKGRRDSSGAVLVQAGGLVLMLSMGFKTLAMWTGWGVDVLYGWGWDHAAMLAGLVLGMALLNIGFLQILLDQIHDERDHVENALWLQRERVAQARQQSVDLATLLREREEIIRQFTLSNKTAGMGALVASFAHELNQPLTATLVHAELIESHVRRSHQESCSVDGEMLQTVAASIVSDTQRASEIIRKLRNLFRISTGEFERIDFSSLVEDMLDIVRSRASRNGVIIDDRLVPNLRILGDPTQLQQVVLNLFNNALDAMQDHEGPLLVGRRLTVMTRRAGEDALELVVEDTGKGIAPGLKDEVFSLFKTTKSNGMGVGLWLSQSIVETHRGWLRFESEPGQGTTFTLHLPMHTDALTG